MPTMPKTFKEEGRFESNPNDFYETPLALCERVWFRIFESLGVPNGNVEVLDPGSGSGRWGQAAKNVIRKHPKLFQYGTSAWITGVDIRPDAMSSEYQDSYTYSVTDDFLSRDFKTKYDCVVGNPPYSSETNKRLALDFALKALSIVKPDGIVALLYKLEFMAGVNRYKDLFRDNPPHEVWVLGRVPWMKDRKGSNTIDYAMFVWNFARDGFSAPEIDWMLDWRNGC
jgi:predicted RNA methylase